MLLGSCKSAFDPAGANGHSTLGAAGGFELASVALPRVNAVHRHQQ